MRLSLLDVFSNANRNVSYPGGWPDCHRAIISESKAPSGYFVLVGIGIITSPVSLYLDLIWFHSHHQVILQRCSISRLSKEWSWLVWGFTETSYFQGVKYSSGVRPHCCWLTLSQSHYGNRDFTRIYFLCVELQSIHHLLISPARDRVIVCRRLNESNISRYWKSWWHLWNVAPP